MTALAGRPMGAADQDIHPGIGQLRGPGVPASPSCLKGSHQPLGQRGKGLQAVPH